MQFLLLFLIGCAKSVPVSSIDAAQLDCALTLKIDATCRGYDRSRYKISDSSGLVQEAVLYPGNEVTIFISSGRFEIERASLAAPGFVFPSGFKNEKTTTSNVCDQKFTNTLICD